MAYSQIRADAAKNDHKTVLEFSRLATPVIFSSIVLVFLGALTFFFLANAQVSLLRPGIMGVGSFTDTFWYGNIVTVGAGLGIMAYSFYIWCRMRQFRAKTDRALELSQG